MKHAMAETPWRLIIDEAASGARNMALDEALLESHATGVSPPILRLYRWTPGAISIGYFQSFGREVHEEGCRRHGFEWVRRITGGRAVLHHRELTYAVVVSGDILPGSVLDTYRVISEGLVAGLRRLGIPAALSEDPPPTRDSLSRLSAACFDSTTTSEVSVEGKKLVGSAQGRVRGVILQHGSIPLQLDRDAVVDCLNLGTRTEAIKRILQTKATAVSECVGREVSFDELAEHMQAGFAEHFGLRLEPAGYEPAERARAAELTEEKYATERWNRAIK